LGHGASYDVSADRVERTEIELKQRGASFETAASRPPQDEGFFLIMSNTCLILRSAEKARLEGRMTVTQLRVDDLDFDPPRALTAPRPASRAVPLVCCSFARSRRFEDRQIADLPASLRADHLLLFNDTKVIPAWLVGRRMLLDMLCRGVGK